MIENRNRHAAQTGSRPDPGQLEKQALTALEAALSQIKELSDERLRAKLSVSRIAGVARELRELIKVLSTYGC